MALQPQARNGVVIAHPSSVNTGPVYNSPGKQLVDQQPSQGRFDPNMLSTADTSDALSPTTLVLNYLKSRGYQPTAENIRRAVEANARDPGVLGPSPIGREADASGPQTDLRNAGVENSSPAPSGGKRTSAPPLPVPPIPPGAPNATPTGGKPPVDQYVPIPDAGSPDTPDLGRVILGGGPPPLPMAPVPNVPPVMPPPPAGAAVALPAPPSPLDAALDKAVPQLPAPPALPQLPAPAEMPALPAPPVRPQIAAPPEVPALPAPTRPLALPAPEPNVGNITDPQGSPGGRVRVGTITPKAPPISPENPVVQTPLSRGVGNVARRAAQGAARGGPRGALGGAGVGIAEELGPEVMRQIGKNLHLW